jgi:hypothetical protein
VEAAVTNPFLTEALVVKALLSERATAALVELVCKDSKWSLRREVRVALLRHPLTPPEQAAQFAQSLPSGVLHELIQDSRLPEPARERVEQELQAREQQEGKSQSTK